MLAGRWLDARIVLTCTKLGLANSNVDRALGIRRMSVTTWYLCFLVHRLDGLVDPPRSGAPVTFADTGIGRMVTLTLENQPENATLWSTRTTARQVGMSQSMVPRVWRNFGLQPHKTDTFKLSTDPAFVDKVGYVVGLYLAPPHRAVVLCVDEKSQIDSLTRTAPVLPMRAGPPERRTHDYRLGHGAPGPVRGLVQQH